MVGDAVEQGAGEALAGEDGGPFLEGQVRGDDCGAVFVAPAEDVEQQLASGLRQGHVSEFVDDQEADLGELGLEAEQSLLVARVPPIYLIRGASRTPTSPPALVMAPSSL